MMTKSQFADKLRDDEYILSAEDLLRIIQRRFWLVVLVAILMPGVVIGISLLQTPLYEASAEVLVERAAGEIVENPNDAQGLQQLTSTMTQAIYSHNVAEEVVRELDLEITADELLKNLNVEQIGQTQLIRVDYRDASPQTAQQIPNTVGEVFSNQISERSSRDSGITATVLDEAPTPNAPISPNLTLRGLGALVIGIAAGVGLALVLNYVDRIRRSNVDGIWRSPEVAEQASGVSTFGVIPEFETFKDRNGETRGPKKRSRSAPY